VLLRHFIKHPRTDLDFKLSFLGVQQIDGSRQAETGTSPLVTLIKNIGHTAVINFRLQLNKCGLVHAVTNIRRILPDVKNTLFPGNLYTFNFE